MFSANLHWRMKGAEGHPEESLLGIYEFKHSFQEETSCLPWYYEQEKLCKMIGERCGEK